jgi:hypothetical protein
VMAESLVFPERLNLAESTIKIITLLAAGKATAGLAATTASRSS